MNEWLSVNFPGPLRSLFLISIFHKHFSPFILSPLFQLVFVPVQLTAQQGAAYILGSSWLLMGFSTRSLIHPQNLKNTNTRRNHSYFKALTFRKKLEDDLISPCFRYMSPSKCGILGLTYSIFIVRWNVLGHLQLNINSPSTRTRWNSRLHVFLCVFWWWWHLLSHCRHKTKCVHCLIIYQEPCWACDGLELTKRACGSGSKVLIEYWDSGGHTVCPDGVSDTACDRGKVRAYWFLTPLNEVAGCSVQRIPPQSQYKRNMAPAQ